MATSWSMTATPTVGLALPEPHASRLASYLATRTPLPVTVLAEADGGKTDWVIVTPDRVAWAAQSWPADRIVVLAGIGPVDPAWAQAGYTVLTGSLPQPVWQWLQTVAPAPPPLLWDDDATAAPAQPTASRGRSIAVYSSGGGVGKTTTTVYLATAAAERGQMVAVVELDEDRRGILTYWHQTPTQGGLDTIPREIWLDPARLGDALVQCRVAVTPQIHVLPMIGTVSGLQYPIDDADLAVEYLMAWLRSHYTWILIDLPARLRDSTLMAVLMRVHQVVWVVEPTEIMLESSRGYLDVLQQLGDAGGAVLQKIRLVVNKVERSRAARLDPQTMADTLGLPLLGTVASNPAKYMAGINQHRVVLTPEWTRIADELGMGAAQTAPARKRWWGRRSRTDRE